MNQRNNLIYKSKQIIVRCEQITEKISTGPLQIKQ